MSNDFQFCLGAAVILLAVGVVFWLVKDEPNTVSVDCPAVKEALRDVLEKIEAQK